MHLYLSLQSTTLRTFLDFDRRYGNHDYRDDPPENIPQEDDGYGDGLQYHRPRKDLLRESIRRPLEHADDRERQDQDRSISISE